MWSPCTCSAIGHTLAHIALLCDKNGFSFFLGAEVTSERLAEAVSLGGDEDRVCVDCECVDG